MQRNHWQRNGLSQRRRKDGHLSYERCTTRWISTSIMLSLSAKKTSVTTSNRNRFVPFAGHPSRPDTTPMSLVRTHFIVYYNIDLSDCCWVIMQSCDHAVYLHSSTAVTCGLHLYCQSSHTRTPASAQVNLTVSKSWHLWTIVMFFNHFYKNILFRLVR